MKVSSSAAARRKQSLRQKALASIGWLLAQNVGARIIGFGSQILLAKILMPGDFASLGLAGTITVIVGVLANFGVDDVLLQRHKTMRFWITPAFLVSLSLGMLSMILVISLAPMAAAMYREPILLSILPIMAACMPISALSTVPTVKIRAEFNFRLLATYATFDLAASQMFTLVLAMKGFGVYSFVLPGPVMEVTRAVTFWIIAKPKFRRMRLKQFRMMGVNTAAVFATKMITALVNQGDYLILGLLAPKPVVGAYFFAFRLAIQPVQMLAGNLSAVLFPAFAQLRTDPTRQREAALNTSRVLAVVVMPYCFMQSAIARPLIDWVFGAKWQVAIPLVQILSVGLGFDAVSWVAGALLSARGEFRRTLIYSCIFSPFFFFVVAIGAFLASAIGVSIAVSLFYVVLAPVFSYAVFNSIGVCFRDVASIYVYPAVFAAIAMGLATCVSSFIPGSPLEAVAIVVLGWGLYLGLIRVFAATTYYHLVIRFVKLILAKSLSEKL